MLGFFRQDAAVERRRAIQPVALFLGLTLVFAVCGAGANPVSVHAAQPVARYAHDARAFTQGLLYHHGELFESTGLHGASSLRRVRIDNGRVLQRHALSHSLFGEGLARVGARLYQLTWKAGVAIVYDLASLRELKRLHYAGEGWGLARVNNRLVMSDGSATLRFVDPADFAVLRELRVTRDGESVPRLNELEYFCGAIWANIRYADVIMRIDPLTGFVTGVLDAAALRSALPNGHDAGVLNGIAWNPDLRRILVTGKNWPLLFALRNPWPCPTP